MKAKPKEKEYDLKEIVLDELYHQLKWYISEEEYFDAERVIELIAKFNKASNNQ